MELSFSCFFPFPVDELLQLVRTVQKKQLITMVLIIIDDTRMYKYIEISTVVTVPIHT